MLRNKNVPTLISEAKELGKSNLLTALQSNDLQNIKNNPFCQLYLIFLCRKIVKLRYYENSNFA
jgi:hypothetical protein